MGSYNDNRKKANNKKKHHFFRKCKWDNIKNEILLL